MPDHSLKLWFLLSVLALCASGPMVAPSAAAVAPPNFDVIDMAPGVYLLYPSGIAFAPDGRLFVIEKRGRVSVMEPNPSAPDPLAPYDNITEFLDLSSEVLSHWDRGMLGLALDPDFENNPWVYLAYAVDPDGQDDSQFTYVRLVRYRESDTTPNTADLSTREVLIGDTWADGIPCAYFSHMGTTLMFGDDGSLLMTTGDGAHFDGAPDGGGRDPDQFLPGRTDPSEDIGAFRSQSLNSMAGKVLRLDKNTGDGLPSNPFFQVGSPDSDQSRIWSLGLRNPYRSHLIQGTGSTNPADGNPGVIVLPDVQWFTWEEVSVATGPGQNFGWPCHEGVREHSGYQNLPDPLDGACPPDDSGLTAPIMEWPHSGFDKISWPIAGFVGKAAVGAAFYSGSNYPIQYRNKLFCGDFPRSWITAVGVDGSYNVTSMEEFASDLRLPVDMKIHPDNGDLVYISWQDHDILRFHYNGPDGIGAPPSQPQNLLGYAGSSEVSLAWDPNPEIDMDGYRVYRKALPDGPEDLLTPDPIEATTYLDATALNGQLYDYTIEAVDTEAGGTASPRTPPLPLIPSAKSWEFWTRVPGPEQQMSALPAPFPRDFVVPTTDVISFEHSFWTNRAPRLWKPLVANVDFTLETREELLVYQAGWKFHTGLMVRIPSNDHYHWGFREGTDLVLERSSQGILATIPNTSPVMSLRVVRTGDQYSFEYRVDDASPWTVGATATESAAVDYVGSIVSVWDMTHELTKRVDRLALNEIAPTAAATPSVLSGSVPLTVDFTSQSFDPDGDLLTYEWDFGDLFTSTEANPTHLYDKPGTYTATLTVQDGSGLRATSAGMVIEVAGNNPPIATILDPADGYEYADPSAAISLLGQGTDEEDPADSLSYDWTVHLHQGGSTTLEYLDPPSLPSTTMVPATTDDGSGVFLEVILTVTDTAGDAAADTVVIHDRALAPAPALELMAALADSVAPPVVPGAASPWADLAGNHDAALAGFDVPGPGSGWSGTGVVGDPYRLTLDGIDDRASVAAGSVAALQGAAEASVELWARWAGGASARTYLLEWLESYAVPFAGFSLAVENDQLQIFLDPWEPVAPLVPGEWFHLVATQSASGAQLFLDGTLVHSSPSSNLGSQVSEIVLGAATYPGAGQHADFFPGDIAELRVYDFALSPANVYVRHAAGDSLYENPPRLSSVQPDSTANDTDLALEVLGEGFDVGDSVLLRRAGEADLLAMSVVVDSPTRITCMAPTTGAVLGDWDVVVVTASGLEATLPQAVQVTAPSPLRLALESDQTDGVNPPLVPGAASPWIDVVDGVTATLEGFSSPGPQSGWQGDGEVGDSYRLRLDGIDDRVRVAAGTIPALQSPGDLTVEMWIAPGEDIDRRQVVLEWRESSTGLMPGCVIVLEETTLRSRLGPELPWAVVLPEQYIHLVMVYEATGVRLYTNGSFVIQVPTANLGSQVSDLILGESLDGGDNFAGDIAALRIFDVALDASTIQARFQAESPRFAPPPPVTTIEAKPDRFNVGDQQSFVLDVVYDDNETGDMLRGASVEIGYDPAVLEILTVLEGNLLPTSGDPTFFASRSDLPGQLVLDSSILGTTTGVSGDGTLARLTLGVLPGAPEGPTDISVTVRSVVSPENPPTAFEVLSLGTQILVDTTAPQTLSAFSMAPLEGGARLDWTPPAQDYDGVTVFYRPWNLNVGAGYPEYDDESLAPAWPADLAAARDGANGWTELELDALDSIHDLELGQRTVVFVVACARDAAGNLSDFAAAPRDRLPTYLLGDLGELDASGALVLNYDGRVDGARDLPVFSQSYGSSRGQPEFQPAADIGPTDLGGSAGVPVTDDIVDFDDLVVFSLTFGTGVASKGERQVARLPERVSDGPLAMALGEPTMQGSIAEVPVLLRGNREGLKAVHLELSYEGEALRYVGHRRNDVLRLASAPVFLTTLEEPGTVAVDMAILGSGDVLEGDGELVTLRFEVLRDLGGSLQAVELDMRDADGLPMEADADNVGRSTLVAPPMAVRLHGAAPNPFNPRTTIRFELPSPQPVKLAVFDVSGRLVRELVHETLPAGYHSVVWHGRDSRGRSVASGVYLYELDAPGFRDVRKMLLVK